MKKKIEVLLILMVFLGNVALSGIGIVSYANDENEDKINIEEEKVENSKKSENDNQELNNTEVKTDEEENTKNAIEENNSNDEENVVETNQLIKDGTYRISMFENKNCHMAMEVENGSKELGANVQIGE